MNAGDYVFVAAEACHGVNFPKGAVPDKMAGRWHVPASERYLADLVSEFMHRYHIDPNRVVLWGYSMGGVGAYNHAMRTDRFAVVGIGAGEHVPRRPHGVVDRRVGLQAGDLNPVLGGHLSIDDGTVEILRTAAVGDPAVGGLVRAPANDDARRSPQLKVRSACDEDLPRLIGDQPRHHHEVISLDIYEAVAKHHIKTVEEFDEWIKHRDEGSTDSV